MLLHVMEGSLILFSCLKIKIIHSFTSLDFESLHNNFMEITVITKLWKSKWK